ncbi:MAG: STAS domain-containing protein, partial [Gammaproteobacteria bacterium]
MPLIHAILMSMAANDQIQYDSNAHQLRCRGAWDLAHLPSLQSLLAHVSWPSSGELTIEGSGITKMDSAGAWLLCGWLDKLKQRGVTTHFESFPQEQQALLSIVQHQLAEETKLPEVARLPWLGRVGKGTLQYFAQFRDYLAFVGRLTIETLRLVRSPSRWRFPALATVVYRNGYQALPIIALLSLMIGVVMTYQMGLQLRSYGANIYIVDLLGLSILREFGPLLTAIMVAGRTGSAFT